MTKAGQMKTGKKDIQSISFFYYLNSGFLFSTKLLVLQGHPGSANATANISFSISRPFTISVSQPLFMAALAQDTADADFESMSLIIFSASSISLSASTTLFTRPILYASSALTCLPVNISSLAIPVPMALESLWVPPKQGISPRFTSGCPNTAFSDAILISQARATSHPPPRAYPFTAAMTGFSRFSMASQPPDLS